MASPSPHSWWTRGTPSRKACSKAAKASPWDSLRPKDNPSTRRV